MSSVTTIEAKSPAREASPRAVALQVLGAETHLLSLDRATTEALAAYRAVRNLSEDLSSAQKASRTIELLPTEPQMRQLREDMERALSAPPDDRLSRILVGLMLDCFAVGRDAQPETFVEALVNDLREMRYPPIVVARALQDVRRSSKFRPAISEVLEHCDAAMRALTSASRVPQMIEESRGYALRVIERQRGPSPTR